MATPIFMPEIAANMTSARLVAWYLAEGDPVQVGQPLADIETDKAVIEYTAEADGILGKILVPAGAEAAVGDPIALLLAEGEAVDALNTLPSATASAAPVPPVASGAESVPADCADRIFASPLARRLAAESGIHLSLIQGSGPHGRIVKRDVQHALQQTAVNRLVVPAAPAAIAVPGAPAATAAMPATAVPAATETTRLASPAPAHTAQTAGAPDSSGPVAGVTRTPHSAMRRTIARRLLESKTTVPHFYLQADCNAGALVALRQQINAVSATKVSLNDLVVRAVAVALRSVPEMNVSWSDDALLSYDGIDISVAVSTPAGLITPVVRGADTLTVTRLGQTIAALAERARAGRLQPHEYQGGTFTVSNLGMYGVQNFAAIINPPQSAILAVGAVEQRPVVEADGAIVAATLMSVTLSVDHRVIDGALAARWLAEFRRCIETPLLITI